MQGPKTGSPTSKNVNLANFTIKMSEIQVLLKQANGLVDRRIKNHQ